ncbi:MAG: hypothetical protein ABEK36_04420 [Candidatus Aenigmatarchaeota archaeon]
MEMVESIGVKGNITLMTSEEEKRANETIQEYKERIIKEDKVHEISKGNMVMTLGKNWIAGMMIGESDFYQCNTNSGLMAFGVGSTAATVSDGSLEQEAWRVTMTSSSRDANKSTWSAYMPKTGSGDNAAGSLVPNGSTLREIGMFVNGKDGVGSAQTPTFAPDTGIMINRATYAAISKTSNLALTAEVDWTID